MEQPLKERIVGAAVLAVAAVVFVPMLLDGSGGVDTETTQLDLKPEPASPVQIRIIRLDEAEQVQVEDMPPQREPVVEPELDQSVPEQKAAEQPVPPEEPPDAVSGWAVQVGSFSSEENAERLAAKLRDRGYPAFVALSLVDGQSMHRVRVGPEPDRGRAETLADRLRRDGQTGKLVEHP